jgi:hypothetical protein
MWLVLARTAQPDARVWSGRHALAAVDAVAWPVAWIVLIHALATHIGAVGLVLVTFAVVVGARRLHRALLANHRYRFTTWTWGRRVVGLLLIGGALKLAAGMFPP